MTGASAKDRLFLERFKRRRLTRAGGALGVLVVLSVASQFFELFGARRGAVPLSVAVVAALGLILVWIGLERLGARIERIEAETGDGR